MGPSRGVQGPLVSFFVALMITTPNQIYWDPFIALFSSIFPFKRIQSPCLLLAGGHVIFQHLISRKNTTQKFGALQLGMSRRNMSMKLQPFWFTVDICVCSFMEFDSTSCLLLTFGNNQLGQQHCLHC